MTTKPASYRPTRQARPRNDSKGASLQQSGTLHARAGEVSDPLFVSEPFFDPRDLLQVKYELLRRVRVDGHAVLPASKAFGLSRPTFYEAQAAFARAGIAGLLRERPGPRSAHKLSAKVMAFVDTLLAGEPSLRPAELARRIQSRFQLKVHPRSIERALERSKKG